MVRVFKRFGLQTILNNKKAVICTLGFIWGQQGSEAYKRRATEEGPTFQERNRTRVSCEECGEIMAAYSLRHHMDIAHGRVLSQVGGVYVRIGGLDVYKLSFPWILKSVDCPVEGCPAKAKTL